MIADPNREWEDWDYIVGDYMNGMSLVVDRFQHLQLLEGMCDKEFKVALRDVQSNAWTKWERFPKHMLKIEKINRWDTKCELHPCYDVHRSTLDCEIVVESDYVCDSCKALKKSKLPVVKGCYDCYGLNYEASRFVGQLIESKGFIPHYYYSGSKSIHIHIYVDFKCFLGVDLFLQKQVVEKFKYKSTFVKKFIEWLRAKIISFWDMEVREFDKDLIKSTHLIRSEMSRNKAGYKTFIGYSYKDLSFVPYVCNEENRIYPKLGQVRLSRPKFVQQLLEDFLVDCETSKKIQRVRRKSASLRFWMDQSSSAEVRSCINLILDDSFVNVGDGYQRGMFILANELKRIHGPEKAFDLLVDWNTRMGDPCREQELEYRTRMKEYSLGCKYLKDYFGSIGMEIDCSKCKHKL